MTLPPSRTIERLLLTELPAEGTSACGGCLKPANQESFSFRITSTRYDEKFPEWRD